MKASTKKKAEDSTSINTLVNEIVKEQQKIVRLEGDVVASHIRIGNRLAELRPLAKKTWGRQLKAIGISPRVASRYLKIAENWPAEIGLIESDLLPRLPSDLLKLEWLCRLPKAKLGSLLGKVDCKRSTRPQVIAAVREALGEEPPAKDEHDVEKFVQRFIDRLMKTVDGLGETFPEAEQQDRVRELLGAGLVRVQDALKAGRGAANGP
jgi:hypothetical protein